MAFKAWRARLTDSAEKGDVPFSYLIKGNVTFFPFRIPGSRGGESLAVSWMRPCDARGVIARRWGVPTPKVDARPVRILDHAERIAATLRPWTRAPGIVYPKARPPAALPVSIELTPAALLAPLEGLPLTPDDLARIS